jgi:hypothetical protein
VVLALAGLGGWLWYSNHQDTVRGRQGEQLTQALDYADAGNPRPSSAARPLAKDGTGQPCPGGLAQAGKAAKTLPPWPPTAARRRPIATPPRCAKWR